MRSRSIAGIVVGGILVALIAGYGVALQVDLGGFKPVIAEAANEVTSRELTIGGELRLVPGFRPALALEDVTLSNAEWATDPSMLRARRVTVAVKFLPLLLGRIEPAHVDISGAEIFLETNASGELNWLFERGGEAAAKATPEEAAATVPGTIVVQDSVLSFRDGQRGGEPLKLNFRRVEVHNRAPDQPLTAAATLEFRGEAFAVDAALPPVVDLIANRPGEIRWEISGAGATLTVEGSVTDFRSGAGLGLTVRGEGPDASRLARLADIVLPTEEPFEFVAEFSGEPAGGGAMFVLSGIHAQLGGNSLSGEASLNTAVPPALVRVTLDLSGGVAGKVDLTARGDGPFQLLGSVTGSFEVARAGGAGGGFSLTGTIGRAAEDPTHTVIEAHGLVGGQDVSLTALFGPLEGLQSSVPVSFDIALGAPESRLAFTGSASDPFGDARINADFEFESGDIGALAQAFGVTAPDRSTSAAGHFESTGSRFAITGLGARLGASDLEGELTLELEGPRPRFIANLASRHLDTDDLVAADAEEAADEETDAASALSEETLPFDALRRFDAVVNYRAEDATANGIGLGPVSFALALEDGDVRVNELEAAPSGVPLSGMLDLSTSAEAPEFKLALNGDQVDLGPALEERGVQVAVASAEMIDIEMSARGGSPRALAESLRGQVRAKGLRLRSQSILVAGVVAEGSDIELDLSLSINGAESDITLAGEGTLGGSPFTVAASLPSFETLAAGGAASLSFDARTSDGFLTLDGEPQGGDVTALNLNGEGPLLRDLASFAGLTLPGAGPHSLKGALRAGSERYELNGLTLVSGQTDLAAEGSLARGAGKTEFDLRLTSVNFDLDDFIAAEAAAEDDSGSTADDAEEQQLPLEMLRDYEGTLAVQFGEVRLGAIRFENLSLAATVRDGALDISEFAALVGGAPLAGRASLAVHGDVAKLLLSFAGEGIDPGAALTDQRIADSFSTTMDTQVELQAEGATRGALISSLNGRVRAIAGEGRFEESKYLFFETGILRQLAPWKERRDMTNLNCFVADFVVENGVATANGLLLDTEFMSVLGRGEIDLGAETFDLTFSPRPKETRILDLAIPVHLGGTFDAPTFLPTPGGVTKKVATTLGALVNPLVLLVPVIESATSDRNPCVEALASAAAEVDPNAEKDVGGVGGTVEGVVDGVEGAVGGVLKGLGRTLKRLGGEE